MFYNHFTFAICIIILICSPPGKLSSILTNDQTNILNLINHKKNYMSYTINDWKNKYFLHAVFKNPMNSEWKAAWTADHSLKGRRRESFHCPRGVGYATHFLERREIDVGILIMLLLLLSYPFYRSSLFSAWCLYAVLLYIFFLSFYDNHIFLILSLSLSPLCYSFIYSFCFFFFFTN